MKSTHLHVYVKKKSITQCLRNITTVTIHRNKYYDDITSLTCYCDGASQTHTPVQSLIG